MVKQEQTDQPVDSNEAANDLESHQDYSNWVITGNRFLMYSPDHSEYYGEYEEVISVEGEKVRCMDCEVVKPSWKPCMNTPSMHATADGICTNCYDKWFKENPNAKKFQEEDLTEFKVQRFNAQKHEMYVMAHSTEGAEEAAETNYTYDDKKWIDIMDERGPDNPEYEAEES